jgi:hypothetical protein
VVWLGLVILLVVAGRGVHRMWARQLSHLTGDAEWVWTTDELGRVRPEAGLFVSTFHLDEPAPAAVLKVSGDREYVAYLNRTVVGCGWSRPGFRLDLYDVARFLRVGPNTLAVEVRSPSPVGGVLAALDVEGVGSNVVTTGRSFVLRHQLDLSPVRADDVPPPVRWGRPPRFPWGYPQAVSRPGTFDEVRTEEPIRFTAERLQPLDGAGFLLLLPRAVFGYVWLEIESDGPWTVWSDPLTTAHNPEVARELSQPVVRLPGQGRWLDVEPKVLGQVWVFGDGVLRAVEISPVPEAFSSTAPGAVGGRSVPEPRTRWTSHIPPG